MRSRPGRDKDRSWLIRTYAGHTSAAASNALFRTNLKRGQTGLSVAFDLPTQTGYDSDHPLARGEVGKVGVPVRSLADMRILFAGIRLDQMNTSMTINAPAAWLLALYVALADETGANRQTLAGTTQNDVMKEYLSRGTYIFPPDASLKLTTDVIAFTAAEMAKWNPLNICSYHLQEAGAEPVQEVAFALASAITVLDRVRGAGGFAEKDFWSIVGRMSFFLNSGIRLITEISKVRAFAELWDEIALGRYGVRDEKLRRFRYGVQVNSLGLTEQQPENNVYRILLEMLPVVLGRNARARAVQLPAWNEALGLPRPWDQQWSLRLQQIVAEETDILEFGDIFDGSQVINETVEWIKTEARRELAHIEDMGGAVAAIETGYMKSSLVAANARRLAEIEEGTRKVVGVNVHTDGAPSPLVAAGESFLAVDEGSEKARIKELEDWRKSRDGDAARAALRELDRALRGGENVMTPSIGCAKAGVTTGEWTDVLRAIFGEYRAPTGVASAPSPAMAGDEETAAVRAMVENISARLGRRLKILVGKPGLDGHSNGAEQIAVRARDAGMDVVYEGIRLTAAEIAATALQEGVHVVGLSILSGSHMALVRDVLGEMAGRGIEGVPVIVGGIIPPEDASALIAAGVARVFTPKDFEINAVLGAIVEEVEKATAS
jgi:(2R)-ethylmalonyl-CoA mutase